MLNKKAFAATAGVTQANYIEDVFSTWLYTGNGSTQTITNGIDLATKGGMVWGKCRNGAATAHWLFDTSRGVGNYLQTQSTSAQDTQTTSLTSFNSNGFSLGVNSFVNNNVPGTDSFASWTFAEQAKFSDVVTYTGNGSNRTIAHNLGSVPGCIFVKRTDTAADWQVYHRSLANTQYMVLNTTAAVATGATRWNSTTPTSTVFSLGTDTTVNASGGTYVAYLFAHDAGGFGLSGNENVISCGSFTTDGSGNATVTLNYEPQFVMMKRTDGSGDWFMVDNMRGWDLTSSDKELYANLSNAENTNQRGNPTATGFQVSNFAANIGPFIYIAIRRGPMRVPTTGASVFAPVAYSGDNGTNRTLSGYGFPLDAVISKSRNAGYSPNWYDRLRGNTQYVSSSSTNAEASETDGVTLSFDVQNGVRVGNNQQNVSGVNYIHYALRRAPGFFDVVYYTGTGSSRTVDHNLKAVPELMIVKRRDTTADWQVYYGVGTEYMVLNSTAARVTSNTDRWNSTVPASSVFSLGTSTTVNASGGTYVNYLFSSCTGVSKIGTYTGTGTTLAINCGFTGGARFVLIKRTDSTGDWHVWDTARGIVSGNDPYLLLNSTAAEVTTTDWIDPVSTGFELSSTAPAALNASGGTYIYLAIA
jgi:hypothetical protein